MVIEDDEKLWETHQLMTIIECEAKRSSVVSDVSEEKFISSQPQFAGGKKMGK